MQPSKTYFISTRTSGSSPVGIVKPLSMPKNALGMRAPVALTDVLTKKRGLRLQIQRATACTPHLDASPAEAPLTIATARHRVLALVFPDPFDEASGVLKPRAAEVAAR